MTSTDGAGGRPTEFPTDPAFHQAVLDLVPTPIIVVDELAQVVYGNRAIIELGGWSYPEDVGLNILEQIHPEDATWVAEAFVGLTTSTESRQVGRPWAPIMFRMLSKRGDAVPLEVTGAGAFEHPDIGGVIYHVQAAWHLDVLQRVVAGLVQGAPTGELLDLVLQIVTQPPLELDVALVRASGPGRPFEVERCAARGPLAEVLEAAGPDVPWQRSTDEPTFWDLTVDGPPPGAALADAGYVDCWHAAVGTAQDADVARLVVASPRREQPSTSARQRVQRASELASVVLARAERDRVLHQAARRDSLTGLLNRRAISEWFDAADRPGPAVAVLYLDLDRFKPINDRHGHRVGDDVLGAVADRLRASCRGEDLIARVGGDEFVVVVPQHADRDLEALARRIAGAIEQPIDVDGEVVSVGVSIGIATSRAGGSGDELLVLADQAMYEAKAVPGASVAIASDPRG